MSSLLVTVYSRSPASLALVAGPCSVSRGRGADALPCLSRLVLRAPTRQCRTVVVLELCAAG
jgi:hypothetical protein